MSTEFSHTFKLYNVSKEMELKFILANMFPKETRYVEEIESYNDKEEDGQSYVCLNVETCKWAEPDAVSQLLAWSRNNDPRLHWSVTGEEQIAVDVRALAKRKKCKMSVYEIGRDDYDEDEETYVQYFHITTVILENGNIADYDIVRDYYNDDEILYKTESGDSCKLIVQAPELLNC